MRDSNTPQRSVVVGIDGSQAAIQAAKWAVDEAVSREVPLRLVHVIAKRVEPAPVAAVGNLPMEVEYAETALRIASAAVEAAGEPVKVKTAILQGDSAATLIAESHDAEMVCVGSVGIGRFAKALLGSTVAELAEAAHCPVAIIRTQQSRPKPGSALIVVAVNDSPDNDDVVEQAMKEARLRHAPVLALGVLREDSGDMPSNEPKTWLCTASRVSTISSGSVTGQFTKPRAVALSSTGLAQWRHDRGPMALLPLAVSENPGGR